jgi:hypothetical protein
MTLQPVSHLSPSRFARYVQEHTKFYGEVQRAKARSQRLLSGIASASIRVQRDMCRAFLHDDQVRLSYVWKAVVRRKAYQVPDTIRRTAKELNAFTPVDEDVSIHVRRFWGRKSREMRKFGLRRFARQSMVGDLIGALHPATEKQFFRRGVPGALKAAEEFVRAGFTHGAEIDVVNFYPSVFCSDELLAVLRPLPGAVVKHVVFDQGPAVSADYVIDCVRSNSSPRIGLPIGSACSPAAGEAVMRAILGSIPDWPMISYHDNVFVFGHSQQEVMSRVEAIRSAAQISALGRLEFGQARHWSHPEPFTFLGRTADDVAQFPWRMRPTDGVLGRYLYACDNANLTTQQMRKIIKGLKSFRNCYDTWDEGDQWAFQYWQLSR